ncbi:hypothetical protein D3C77_502960 [compost metagenome]
MMHIGRSSGIVFRWKVFDHSLYIFPPGVHELRLTRKNGRIPRQINRCIEQNHLCTISKDSVYSHLVIALRDRLVDRLIQSMACCLFKLWRHSVVYEARDIHARSMKCGMIFFSQFPCLPAAEKDQTASKYCTCKLPRIGMSEMLVPGISCCNSCEKRTF